MKFVTAIVCFILAFASAYSELPVPEPQPTAVIELFSSQECSSCPGYEQWFHENFLDNPILTEYNILCLGRHVSYWPQYGWTDQWDLTINRQLHSAYANANDLEYVATPQFFINGQYVSPADSTFNNTLEYFLDTVYAAAINVKATERLDGDTLLVEFNSVNPDNLNLFFCITENHLIVDISSGENAGKTLEYNFVVRAYAYINPQSLASGFVKIPFPSDVNMTNARLSAFIQSKDNYLILSGTKGQTLEEFSDISVYEHVTKSISVYPNPAVDIITVEHNTSGFYQIFDNLGQPVMQKKLQSDKQHIDLGGLAPGMYSLILSGADGNIIAEEKFIKSR